MVGWLGTFFNEELAIRKWICERRIYIAQAMLYFNGRDDFIEIDITTSTQWTSELRDFLKRNSFPVKESALDKEKTIHENIRGSDHIDDQSLLGKYKLQVDNILSEIDRS